MICLDFVVVWDPEFSIICGYERFYMYKFYSVIVSSRISALVDDFGVVCWGLWTTVW